MYSIQGDISSHLDMIERNPMIITYNSIMRLLVYTFGFARTDLMFCSFPFILSLSVVIKYLTIRFIINDFCNIEGLTEFISDKMLILGSIAISFAAPVFSFLNFYSNSYYRGFFSTSIWHNPTTIVMLPFSLLLFWFSYKFIFIKDEKFKNFLLIVIFSFINLFTKPAFLMPFLPTFLIFLFFNIFHNRKILTKRSAVILIVLLFVSAVFIFFGIFLFSKLVSFKNINISPIVTIGLHNRNYDISSLSIYFSNLIFNTNFDNTILIYLLFIFIWILKFVFANAFSLSTFFCLNKKTSMLYLYSAICFILSLAIFLFISEKGSRANDGNFSWQIVPCEIIMMITSFNVLLYDKFKNKKLDNFDFVSVVCFGLLFVQLYDGLIYIQKLIFEGVIY